ncbi:hypothetical protein [Massilia antarctica]|uniref:hypothetical protein n=1 Tax=Massilia antarctica TaxID=2765360 RepID=UPI00226DE3C6|nr:hypothetical protein [Massilia sp. H27-R4]MCY0916312.1 hypothetical protein [Massilia sp. H27-R4]
MPAPDFVQDGSAAIFWLAGAQAIAYLPSAGFGFSGTITLDQAWADTRGVYLFLDNRPADTAAALPQLKDFIARLGFAGSLRLVWLTTGTQPPTGWQALGLQVSGTSLAQSALADFNPYSLLVGQGAAIAPAAEAAGWGFTLTPSVGASFLWRNEAVELTVTGAITIPFSGAAAGCLTFQLPVPDLAAFGAALSFFYETTVESDEPATDAPPLRLRTGFAETLALPLLSGPLTGALSVALDPTRPLDNTRTAFNLPAGAALYPSRLTSPRGHPISLSALAPAGTIARARFLFQPSPLYVGATSTEYRLHLVPDGGFGISVGSPQPVKDAAAAAVATPWTPPERLLCGMSGVEYVGLSQAAGCRVVFTAGQEAFAPSAALDVAPPDDMPPLQSLNALAMTAWASVLPPAASTSVTNYFSQPERAPLYGMAAVGAAHTPRPASSGAAFLFFTELPSAQAGKGDTGPVFPLAPYLGLDPGRLADARRLEASAIAPARRAAMVPPSHAFDAIAATPTRSVTPQGLVVDWDYADPMLWTDVVLGNAVDPVAQSANLLQLSSVRGPLRTALQTNRLFLVGACPGTFATGGSVHYRPGADTFAALIAAQPSDMVYPSVAAWYKTNSYPMAADEAAFQAILNAIPGVTVDQAHFEALRQISGTLRAEISGWRFQFSPWSWTVPGDATCSKGAPGTLMLLKFAPGKLSEMAADPARWSWGQVASFGGSTQAVRDKLTALIDDARERRKVVGGKRSVYDHFLDAVVDNVHWSGVLVLGVPIPLSQLPGPLQCLAAGIDPARFTAHHVGLNATAFQAGTQGITLSQTSMFGLIDYQDPKELHLDPSPDAGFAYKVQSLTVEFANSATKSFSTRVALLAPHLFGSTITLRDTSRGNSILMDGVFQKPANAKSDADGTYVFRIVEESLYDVADSVLSTIDIKSAEFSTVAPAATGDPNAVVQAQFRLGGALAFQQLTDFDILSYGPAADGSDAASALNFRNLLIDFSFPLYKPQIKPLFAESADKLTTDPRSPPRTQSLVNRFPVKLAGLIGVPVKGGQAPNERGYSAADTPLPNSRLAAPWWGIVYEIDLGTGGALSSGSALTLTVLAAWTGKGKDTGTGDGDAPLYVGVHLPGLKDLVGADLPFESFLRMGFRNIKFSAYDTDTGDRAYILRFRRFSISVLGVSFPPGNMDVVLFGNPSGDKSKVGWYAAYAADEDKKKTRLASPQRLRQAARRGVFGRG